MARSTFNVIDEPWLLVKTVSGTVETVSMRTLFHRAHEFRSLAGELPSQNFAVLRVLLAVLYRVFDAESHDDPVGDWHALWQQQVLPTAEIDDYLDRWQDRFDLFDTEQPWFQVGDLSTINGETKPVDLLIPDCSTEDTLFTMRRGYDSISAAEATRWLIHCQAYDVSGIKSGAIGDDRVKGGKGYPIGIGWAGWLGAITIVGDTLRETLLLNLVFDRHRDADDLPVWELPALTAASRPNARGRGQLSLMTWPQRRIRLFHDSNGQVTSVIIANGDPIDYQFQLHHEVMSGWRLSAPQTKKFGQTIYMPRGFDPSVALWRGIAALLPSVQDQETKDYVPCRSLTWAAELAANRRLPADRLIRIETVAVTYGPQSASWDEIVGDGLNFNASLASDQPSYAKEIVYSAVDRANQGARALGDLAGNLALAAGGERDGVSETAKASAFAALDGPFRAWLAEFDPNSNVEESLAVWTSQAREIIRGLADELLATAGPAAFVGRIVSRNNREQVINTGQSDAWFRGALNRALPNPTQQGVSA